MCPESALFAKRRLAGGGARGREAGEKERREIVCSASTGVNQSSCEDLATFLPAELIYGLDAHSSPFFFRAALPLAASHSLGWSRGTINLLHLRHKLVKTGENLIGKWRGDKDGTPDFLANVQLAPGDEAQASRDTARMILLVFRNL